MSRMGQNIYNEAGRLIHGYDYEAQAWVEAGRYVMCAHPTIMRHCCAARTLVGRETPTPRTPSERLDGTL